MMEEKEDPPPVISCILHVKDAVSSSLQHDEDTVREEIIHLFSDETFHKAQLCANIRKCSKGKSKYKGIAINFPSENSSTFGFHRNCYSNFTAVKKSIGLDETTTNAAENPSEDPAEARLPRSPVTLRSSIKFIPESSRGVLEKMCLFCRKIHKQFGTKKEQLIVAQTKNFEEKVRKAAEILGDFQLLATVGERSFAAAEVCYHDSCCKKYMRRTEKIKSPLEMPVMSQWATTRQIHKTAFQSLVEFIQLRIIDNEEVFMLSDIHKQYLAYCEENGLNNSDFLQHHMKKKLEDHFQNQLRFEKSDGNGLLILKTGMKVDGRAARLLYDTRSEPSQSIKHVAYLLRKEILSIPKTKVDASSIESIVNGEGKVPQLLRDFFEALVGGPGFNSFSPFTKTRIDSMCEDAVFMVTKGKIAPGKQVSLGLAVKSLTGSKQLLQILNRFGQKINYNKAEEIETALAYSIASKNSPVPDGIAAKKGLATYTAFDNYDEFCQTFTGQGSLHETVGICFQTVHDEIESLSFERADEPFEVEPSTTAVSSVDDSRHNRKRSYQYEKTSLEPYPKKPKLIDYSFTLDLPIKPESYEMALLRDKIWLMSIAVSEGRCPMWVGFNSLTVTDPSCKKTVAYLKNYNETSTSPSMVLETLKVAKDIAEKCEQPYAVATYDLNIAKPAMQIQSDLSYRFGNVFINFGAFHLFLAYFSAIGKIIAGSGISEVLSECGIIGPGSVNGFIAGRHYNRCKRIHPILAAALQTCHLQLFEEIEGPLCDEVKMYVNSVLENPDLIRETIDLPREVAETLAKYETFLEKTRNGDHGATAQFWLSYVDLVRIWLVVYRSVKLNDVDLFTYVLPKMTNLFFATNHVNYARWMVVYHQQLLHMEERYPGLKEEGGLLSIKRTSIPFSGTPVDQTLEQTVNRDAASRQTGTAAFNTQPGARMRWTVTRSARSRILSAVKEMVHLNRKEDVSSELRKSRISRDNKDITSIVNFLKESLNPFSTTMNDTNLYNISNGKGATSESKSYLTSVMELGENLRLKFLGDCANDPSNVERSVKKQKIQNFESNGVKFQAKSGEKVKELRLTSALFGRICCLAISQNIDLRHFLTFPLTPVPLALATVDGSMNKTAKAQIMNHLIGKLCAFNSKAASTVNYSYAIVDGMFLIHTIPCKGTKTFGDFSRIVLATLKRIDAERIDIVFDTYVTPSIKQIERDRREGFQNTQQHSEAYMIEGPEQKCPLNWSKALKNDSFKKQLVKFLTKDWKNAHHHSGKLSQSIFVASDTSCYAIQNGHVNNIADLECYHEEADTRMYFHYAQYCNTQLSPRPGKNKNVCVRTNDTDVLMIFLGNMGKLGAKIVDFPVFFDQGTGANRKTVSVGEIYKKLSEPLASSLPAFHAFTGCDFTASFARKGKIRPFKILETDHLFQNAFASLGASADVPLNTMKQLSRFTATLYGEKTCNINEARFNAFMRLYGSEKTSQADPCNLPPCEKTLRKKVARTNYICSIWRNAEKKIPSTFKPADCGWLLLDDKYYNIDWFDGEHLPKQLCGSACDINEDLDEEDQIVYDSNTDTDDDDDETD